MPASTPATAGATRAAIWAMTYFRAPRRSPGNPTFFTKTNQKITGSIARLGVNFKFGQ